ncbi:MAG: hydrogenase nickel incorporation protein HypB [Coriobacteriales bacterium]|jgi:hydrogenase nickel incorporation protein HypB|nr:hydrogenase nickel incorporation protein HypB [Coriobacteriales bacterium]
MEIEINTPILELNARHAESNRQLLAKEQVYMLDIMASPGAGKTSCILSVIDRLRSQLRLAVIEGDVASDVDAQRIKQAGLTAVQINTGGACHLEAMMIARALDALSLSEIDFLIVENVGNLVCPTEFDLGEHARVVILSVPEGHDKPQKYPGIFASADAIVVNKIDTLPLFDFDMAVFKETVKAMNPTAPVFTVSARTGEGMDDWCEWLANQVADVVG